MPGPGRGELLAEGVAFQEARRRWKVAMVDDRVNDAPALMTASVGVAMVEQRIERLGDRLQRLELVTGKTTGGRAGEGTKDPASHRSVSGG